MPKAKVQASLPMQIVAVNLRHVRDARRLSVRALSALTRQRAGAAITANGIHEIEQGQRRVDVDDLMSLAAALDVSPAVLLMPAAESTDEDDCADCEDDDGRGAVVHLFDPEEPLTAEQVWAWITGEAPLRDAVWWKELNAHDPDDLANSDRWYGSDEMHREWRQQRFAPKFAWKKENDDGAQ